MRLRPFLIAATALLALACFALDLHPSFAQDAPTTTVPGTTVTTSGPVTSDTRISIGTFAGQLLLYIISAVAVPISGLIMTGLVRLLARWKIELTDARKAQLQAIIVNGANLAAAAASKNLAGRAPVELKNKVVADTIEYTLAHGSDVIKQLGLDPNSEEALQAIRARIETAIVDPATPTHPLLEPTVPEAPPK